MAGVAVTRLQDQVFVANGQTPIPTAGHIPMNRRINSVLFVLDVDLTQPGAGQAAQLGAVQHQLLSLVKIGRRVNVTGLGLRILNWMRQGREINFPAGFPATAGGVFSRRIVWQLSYVDHSSRSPFDGCPPSELWKDPIEVRFGSNAIFAATAPTIAGTLRTYVIHDDAGSVPGKTAYIPTSLVFGTDDFSALQAQVQRGGRYIYAAIFREQPNDPGGITSAQVTNVTSYIDGTPLLNNLRSQDAASVFNAIVSDGAGIEFESQTDPRGGELLDDLPGVAAAAGQATNVDFLPVVMAPKGWLLSGIPYAREGLKLELQGTLGAYKVAYLMAEPRNDAGIAIAAPKLGLKGNARFTHKTASKAELNRGSLAAFLPLRLHGE